MKRVLKIVTPLKGPIVWTLIIAVGLLAVYPLRMCFVSVAGALHCPDLREEPMVAERDFLQASIDTFMLDNHLAEVTPSTSGAGGEKINGTGSQFHATLNLQPYMRDAPSTYCYRWQSDGLVIFQYDVNADGNCTADGDQLFP